MANPKMPHNKARQTKRNRESEREREGGGDAAGNLKRPKEKERVMVD